MAAEDYRKALAPYLVGEGPGSDGEQRMYCPLHENKETSKSASASVKWSEGLWHCMSCKQGGSVQRLVREMRRPQPKIEEKASYNPFPWMDGGEVHDLSAKRRQKSGESVETISEAKVASYVGYLEDAPTLQKYLIEQRGLTRETIHKYQIGYDEKRDRYTIPIRDENGQLVNIRRYKVNPPEDRPKMTNAKGHGSPARLYPYDNLSHDTLIVCEGEWDALVSTQNGFPAVTGTHGVGTWDRSWAKLFEGKTVYICFDNDEDGIKSAKQVSRKLAKVCEAVYVVTLSDMGDGGDLTDFWVSGGTAQAWQQRLATADLVDRPAAAAGPKDEDAIATPVRVVGSMDSSTNGKPLSMQVTITGKRDPTYSVPKKARLVCTLDAGPKCAICPMNIEHQGEVEVEIKPFEIGTINKFVDANDKQVLETLREYIGAMKCNRLEREEIENFSVEELFVAASIDTQDHVGEADYTNRRIYNVGNFDTKTNTVANIVGTTVPNQKDRRNEFYGWKMEEAITSIDKFELSPEKRKALEIFQPAEGQKPIDKCREIAQDLSDNVTGILGRERLHMCIDLVYHSVLHFPLDDKIISRGWLEFLVVGDTRTGKSETATRLVEYYGLGHVIGCEGATFAGLVGAAKQVGDAWTIRWGEITINDRRLVVLDEAGGLSTEIIGQLSDIRSRGVAQLTKVESQQTRARVRTVWISNPRKGKFVDEKRYDGIDIIEELIGNPEDIARFDLAMSVSQRDVPNSKINTWKREKVPHVYEADACRELILWAWSRKPDQVQWHQDAYRKVYEAAEWLGQRYLDSPPLIQRTNVREKIARIAVAIAARTFSCDETGEKVVVTMAHVRDAAKFLDELYSYDNFGYLRVSRRVQKNRKIAKKNRQMIRKWLLENKRLLDFLVDRRGSFRSQDLEELAHMGRDEVNFVLSKLADAKMVSKQKSQIVLEPELHDLLREIETETL